MNLALLEDQEDPDQLDLMELMVVQALEGLLDLPVDLEDQDP